MEVFQIQASGFKNQLVSQGIYKIKKNKQTAVTKHSLTKFLFMEPCVWWSCFYHASLRRGYQWESILKVEPHSAFIEEIIFRVVIVSNPIYDSSFVELPHVLNLEAEEVSKIITRTGEGD